jgi:hypothetical protein
MHLHEFLAHVHNVVKPRLYLEVGVQHGTSLNLAHAAEVAIGIDPQPLIQDTGNQNIYRMTSDEYFHGAGGPDPGHHLPIDFGFIDGLHHFEQALRDFLNIERHAAKDSVVVLDDVLPRNQEEANRVQCPGDWTGDVWKVSHILMRFRSDLTILEVNTQPTGTLLVYGFGRPKKFSSLRLGSPELMHVATEDYMDLNWVPDATINRAYAVDPVFALDELENFLSSVDEE